MSLYSKEGVYYKYFYKDYFKDKECTLLHREDGPAREWDNGDKEWWVNGKLHRDGGPAIEYNNSQEWWLNGFKHRVDGPAIIKGFYKLYYLEGVGYSEDEFWEEISKRKRFGDFV